MTIQTSSSSIYSPLGTPPQGTTETGLDQIITMLGTDSGLLGANEGENIRTGIIAANKINKLIVKAIKATGSGVNGEFTVDDVVNINAWIRENHLEKFTGLHGDDEGNQETGFHLLQNNGAIQRYQGNNLVDTVIDGLYHIGFPIENGVFLNEDGDANASVADVAQWLTEFFTDYATTNTGLDRITELIIADQGLTNRISWQEIAEGADAANSINELYQQGISELNLDSDGWISENDIIEINNWIRSDATRYQQFVDFHGDDENQTETGYHLVQNDGANTRFFGENLVNTVADGLYHIGFEIQDGQFRNEDGNANATVADVADWINYFYTDQSTTGTGLDQIVDTIKLDSGLARNTNAGDINEGAEAANSLNHLIVEAIEATGIDQDGWITTHDVRNINYWIRTYNYDTFMTLHGDDEGDRETGYHLVQNDGAKVKFLGNNLINTVADGIYHIGFAIEGDRLLNEDGNANASLSSVSSWLNYFYGGKSIIYGSHQADYIIGTSEADHIIGKGGNDTIDGGKGDDLIEGSWGKDVLSGGAGNDILEGNGGDDFLDGGKGSDYYLVSGTTAKDDYKFEGYDTYSDSGAQGTDVIVAVGDADVDIGLINFAPDNGIEEIDATEASGTVRLLGNWQANQLDFSAVTMIGDNLVIDGGGGHDTITGSQDDNTLIGGQGNDFLDGGEGSDRYLVSGTTAKDDYKFEGYDTYSDSGSQGTDVIVAVGEGNVDIGVINFAPDNGIEEIDATEASGTVRLLGNWQGNQLDFSAVTMIGDNLVIDGGGGHDTITGSQDDNTLIGGQGNDFLDGGEGSDRYLVSGTTAKDDYKFEGYDTYSDSGAQGTDVIVAVGDADVDIGLINFAPDNGIEEIDATEASGTVRLLGNWQANQLDFSAVTMTGDNLVIDGGGGHDTVIGSQKDDLIFGGSGNDELTGGAGFDQLTGESGRDTFIFSSIADIGKGLFKDVITDFSTKKDLIDLSQIDANPVLADDQAFIYISDAEFTGQIGELRFASNILSGDIDGDQLSDFELGMDGVSSLNSSDLVL